MLAVPTHLVLALLFAQIAPSPPRSDALQAAVEAYLSEPDGLVADRLFARIVARDDASGVRLLAAVRDAPDTIGSVLEIEVPHRGRRIAVRIVVPEQLDRSAERLPVVLDISGGFNLRALALHDAVLVSAQEFRPPEFSDQGRDGFLKILRAAAHVAHGDPDQLWLIGYSWAAHASFDTALHRPNTLRGIVPMAGGPRRIHYRLLENLVGVRILSYCGARDDPELLWNLRELERSAKSRGLSYNLVIDPDVGHDGPLHGLESVAEIVLSAGPRNPADRRKGRLLADGPGLESPLLRLDEVDPRRVRIPGAIPVSASLSADGKRRATLRVMQKRVARIEFTVTHRSAGSSITLRPTGVTRCTVLIRAPEFTPGHKLKIVAGRRTVFSEPLRIDPRALLEEARRTGERLRPAIRRVAITF